MEYNEYIKHVKIFINPILKGEASKDNFLIGMVSELGEITDIFKKYYYDNKSYDEEALIEEIGDFIWYYTMYITENIGYDILIPKINKYIISKAFIQGYDCNQMYFHTIRHIKEIHCEHWKIFLSPHEN